MELSEFMLSEKASIDKFEEGSLIVDDDAQTVLCLGKFETSILDLLLTKGRTETITILKHQYNDDRIEDDINEFCNNLIRRSVIIRR